MHAAPNSLPRRLKQLWRRCTSLLTFREGVRIDHRDLPGRDIEELAHWEPEQRPEATKTVTLPSVSPARRQPAESTETTGKPLTPAGH